MPKQTNPIVISYAEEYQDEYDFIVGLKSKGINKRFYIYEAIREKIASEQEQQITIPELLHRIETLEREIKNRPQQNVVYLQKEVALNVDQVVGEEVDEELLKNAVGMLEW